MARLCCRIFFACEGRPLAAGSLPASQYGRSAAWARAMDGRLAGAHAEQTCFDAGPSGLPQFWQVRLSSVTIPAARARGCRR